MRYANQAISWSPIWLGGPQRWLVRMVVCVLDIHSPENKIFVNVTINVHGLMANVPYMCLNFNVCWEVGSGGQEVSVALVSSPSCPLESRCGFFVQEQKSLVFQRISQPKIRILCLSVKLGIFQTSSVFVFIQTVFCGLGGCIVTPKGTLKQEGES